MNPIVTALMIPFLGTALGSAFVFFMKRDMPDMLQKVLLGFASGVMVAATLWSLIIPAIGMGEGVAIAGALTADFNMAGALVLLLATSILGIMPYMLAFAAGAMLDVVL